MNHQIEDNIDVQAPRRKYGKAVDFEKLRFCRGLPRRSDDGIESLDMADLQYAFVSSGSYDEAFCLLDSGGYRFLDEHINSVLEKIDANARMIESRYCQTHRIDFAEEVPVI